MLPLQAYLQYLEHENIDVYSSVTNVRTSTHPSQAASGLTNSMALGGIDSSSSYIHELDFKNISACLSSSLKSSYTSNQMATLVAINKMTPGAATVAETISTAQPAVTNEIVLAQKLYKMIISIDYSPQMSNLEFIRKSLEKVFEKLGTEYDRFYRTCALLEPQIYVTVLLWNATYFQYRRQQQQHNRRRATNMFSRTSPPENEQPPPPQNFIPFTVICHAKRLLKANIDEMASFVFTRVNE